MLKKIKEILNRSFDNKEISYKKMNEILKNRNAYLIDVRSIQEYKEGHLNGAINIPVFEIERKIEEVVKNKETDIIVYCSSGGRSRQAKEILDRLGFKNVYNLKTTNLNL